MKRLSQYNAYKISIFYVETATFLCSGVRSGPSWSSIKPIITVKAIKSVHGLLHFILDLPKFQGSFTTDSIDEFCRKRVVCPSQENFILFMLQIVVFPLVELCQVAFCYFWRRSIFDGLYQTTVELIAKQTDRLWGRRSCDFFQELFSMHSLLLWVFQEECLWLKVENSRIAIVC